MTGSIANTNRAIAAFKNLSRHNIPFLLLAAALACGVAFSAASCVIPGPPDTLIVLEAKPDRNIVPVGAIFDPKTELTVTAFFNTGEAFFVPADVWSACSPPDTSSVGERSGSVEYRGKTASYTIYVYDGGATGPYTSGGPEMRVPL